VEKGSSDNGMGAVDRRLPRRGEHAVDLRVLVALLLPGLVPAGLLTFVASYTICGISGCSGGGFGRSTDPGTTIALLVSAGLVEAAPLAIYAVWRRNPRAGLLAGLVAIIVTVAASWLIGSDFRGCPTNIDTATCIQESS
jgi:hypothetical protein